MILPSFLAIALFLTRNAVLVSSFGCVLSLFLVVVGHEHVRGPIGILSWYAYRAGLTDAVIEIVVMSALPVGGMLTSGVLPNMRGRFVLSSLAAIGMLAVWCYWTFNSCSLAGNTWHLCRCSCVLAGVLHLKRRTYCRAAQHRTTRKVRCADRLRSFATGVRAIESLVIHRRPLGSRRRRTCFPLAAPRFVQ